MVVIGDRSFVFRTRRSQARPTTSIAYVLDPSGVKASTVRASPTLVEVRIEIGFAVRFREKRLAGGTGSRTLLVTKALVASGVMTLKSGRDIPVNGLSAVGG